MHQLLLTVVAHPYHLCKAAVPRNPVVVGSHNPVVEGVAEGIGGRLRNSAEALEPLVERERCSQCRTVGLLVLVEGCLK